MAQKELVNMLELKNVTSYYGKTPIVNDINVSVKEGQCLCVLGRNGGQDYSITNYHGLNDKYDWFTED